MKDIEIVCPGIDDMKSISEAPGVTQTQQALADRLLNGWVCLGIKHDNRLIAWMWSNPHTCSYSLMQFPLRKNEVYLTDAVTLEEFRGRNLAPWLRQEFYRLLCSQGKTVIYSVTEYFNLPAIAFKKKLGARPLSLYLHILLWKKRGLTLRLKKY